MSYQLTDMFHLLQLQLRQTTNNRCLFPKLISKLSARCTS